MEQLSLFETEKKQEPKPKRNKNPEIWHEINGQPIPYSFREMVIRFCKQTATDPARVFFRAEESGAKNPMAWIRMGMKGECYALKACTAEYKPKTFVEWKEAFWFKKVDGPESIKNIFRELAK